MKFAKYIFPAILLLFVLAGGFAFAVELGDSCVDDAICQVDLGSDAICLGADPERAITGSCFISAPEGPKSAGEVLQIIEVISEWIFAIFLAISVIFLIWGAFEFVIGQGDPQKLTGAKQRLLWAVIGIALALVANGADNVLRSILT